MNILGKVAEFLSGGVGSKVMDIIDRQFPGKLTAQERAELDLSLQRLDAEREKEGNKVIMEASKALNARIAEYEGTAADIKSMFIVGPLVIMIRSLFRPICSYVTLYLDYYYFVLGGSIDWQDGTSTLLLVINLIVLGFWFGERTIKNLMPLFMAWLDGSKRQPKRAE